MSSAAALLNNTNDTIVPYHHVNEKNAELTPQEIAGIVFGSLFVFYFTMMFIVCMGEYCQYKNGKKHKPLIKKRRPSGQPSHTENSRSSTRPTTDEASSSQAFSSSEHSQRGTSPNQSTAQNSKQSRKLEEVSVIITQENESFSSKSDFSKLDEQCPISKDSIHLVNRDFPQSRDSCYLKTASQLEMAMVPLISRPCSDNLEGQSDIMCESELTEELLSKIEATV
ncbi:hypothetical protein CHS0354_036777 [Potamilus streckersoni]|uniref:Uncharacterized protein n=1 Tax=Potamilus streckersoni TaxID=2493646 RepID=A0AAE0S581_9BIVA|nr:hypothetical protein CHS0354_036777 [Potamilus streckersoni]